MAAAAKVAVVVGVGPGLGGAVARKFAREGYAVGLVARRAETIAPIQQQIQADGGKALALPFSAASAEGVDQAYKSLHDQLGSPQVLVYNLGPSNFSWPPPAFLDIPLEKFQAAFDAGVTGAFLWAQKVLPAMLEAGQGTIIFTGAAASLRGGAKFALLSAPKFALRSLAQSLAREFQPKGVHVSHVIIDGIIGDREEWIKPDAIADTYWALHSQDPSAWTHELELRPRTEKW